MAGTIILTGAAGGLGFTTMEKLLREHPESHLIVTVRDTSASNAQPVKEAISSYPAASIMSLNLGERKSVEDFCAEVKRKINEGECPPIQALILNAAMLPTYGPPPAPREKSANEESWNSIMINCFANFLLVKNLVLGDPNLITDQVRIVNVTSGAAGAYAKKLKSNQFGKADLRKLAFQLTGNPSDMYAISKFCMAILMGAIRNYVGDQYHSKTIGLLSVDPGIMLTPKLVARASKDAGIGIKIFGRVAVRIAAISSWLAPNWFFRTLNKSADDVVSAAVKDPLIQTAQESQVMLNGAVPTRWPDRIYDKIIQDALWELSLEIAGKSVQNEQS